MHTALLVSDVAKRYRAGVVGCFASVDALRGVSLSVPAGEHVGLFGPAGAGKTTLLLCAAGVMRPDAGRICWFGEASATRDGGWAPPGVTYVPERVSCYAFLTVREALDHYGTLQELAAADRRARVGAAIERLALGAPRRALHLTVSRPRHAAALLRTRVRGVEHDAERVRVSLDGASPEEVLAHCAQLEIAVHTARVVADDLHERLSELLARRGRVAESRE